VPNKRNVYDDTPQERQKAKRLLRSPRRINK
jgi:hypothetical protein